MLSQVCLYRIRHQCHQLSVSMNSRRRCSHVKHSFVSLFSLLRLLDKLHMVFKLSVLWVKIQENLIMKSANIYYQYLWQILYSDTGSTPVSSLFSFNFHVKSCPRRLTLFEAGTLGSLEHRCLLHRWLIGVVHLTLCCSFWSVDC